MSPASETPPRPGVEFWFDFISPFGYVASLRIDELAARHGRAVDWRPLLLGVTVLKVMGLPAVPKTPLKGAYAGRQLARYLRRHGLVLGREPGAAPMNPLPCGRLFAWLKAHAAEHAKPAARAILDAYWIQALAMDDPATLRGVVLAAGVPASVVDAGMASPEAAALLKAQVDAAIAAGAFGSPFVIADGEPFFGVDNFELLEAWLEAGGW